MTVVGRPNPTERRFVFTPEELQELEADANRRSHDQHTTDQQFAEALENHISATTQEDTK